MPHPPLRSRPTSAGSTKARPSSAGRERSAVPTVSRGKDIRTANQVFFFLKIAQAQ